MYLLMNYLEFLQDELFVRWLNFRRHALATAAPCCVHVAWILIDVAK